MNDIARFPWMLGLWKKSQLFKPRGFLPTCGAALISLKHALTAAHCVNDHSTVTSYILRGASILNRLTFMGGSIIPIKEIRVHPDFNPFVSFSSAKISHNLYQIIIFNQGYIFLKISETIPYPDMNISKLFQNFKEILGHKLQRTSL